MKNPLDILGRLISKAETEEALICDPKSRKVGSFIKNLPSEDREILSELKSDDIKNVRYKERPSAPNSRLVK